MDEISFYNYCPIGGIVCSLCMYPIPTLRQTLSQNMLAHEQGNNKHVSPECKTSLAVRSKIEHDFVQVMQHMVDSVTNKLPGTDDARKEFILYIDGCERYYPYCSECQMLVHDKRKHKNKAHAKYCKTNEKGYTSKYWLKNQPKVLSVNFCFDDKSNFNSIFWNLYQKKIQIMATGTAKSKIFHNLLFQQACTYDTYTRDMLQLRPVNFDKNPSLWLKYTNWDGHLQNSLAIDIYNTTIEFNNSTEVNLKNAEKQMVQSLYDVVHFVCTEVERNHQMFFEVERRPSCADYPSSPFNVLLRKSTWTRYIEVFRTMFRVVVRVYRMRSASGTINSNTSTSKTFPDVVRYTEQQQLAIGKMMVDSQPNKNDCIAFLISLVDQQYTSTPYECVLISAIACMSICPDLKYKSAENTTCTFAALLAVYKSLIIYVAINQTPDLTEKEKMTLCIEYTERLLNHPGKKEVAPSAMSWVIHTFSYATVVSASKQQKGHVSWSNDVITFRLIRFSMVGLRSAILTKVDEAQKLLLEMCECPSMKFLPQIPWSDVFDDECNTTACYSFLTEPKNKFVTENKNYHQNHRNINEWIFDEQSMAFDGNRTKQLAYKMKCFLELLLPLVHITSGQPARGTELIILQHCNSVDNQRNIFIWDGMVRIDTRYYKNMAQTNQNKLIHRFLPLPVGELLVYYLWLVLPFYQLTQTGKQYRSSFLWTDEFVANNIIDRTWQSDKLTTTLDRFFGQTLGVHMNCSSYRHIAIAIARRWLQNSFNIKEARRETDENNVDNDHHESDDDVWDLQAGHSTKIARRIYARTLGESNFSNQTVLEKYRYISDIWHNFLIVDNNASKKAHHDESSIEQVLMAMRKKRFEMLYEIFMKSPLRTLRNFLDDDNAVFRGNQEQVMKEVVLGTPYILQITGTGVGKSLSFLLPISITMSGTTIVVVPLLLLQHDLLRRCEEKGISCSMWHAMKHNFNPRNSVVFVTPESAVTDSFFDYVNLLKCQHLLDRVVIDECHLLLSFNDSFRKRMTKISEFVKIANTQLLMMTATLPKSHEDMLFNILEIHGNVKVVRERTVRKNISYEVREVCNRSYLPILQQIIHQEVSGRCIIYARNKIIGHEVAVHLGCDFFHSEAVEKKNMYKKWLEQEDGHPQIIVASNALGCGVDISDVRYVIHVGAPHSIIDFAQESGRAGRDGKDSKSILLHLQQHHFTMHEDMHKYINSGSFCRRCVLDIVLDDEPEGKRRGCENGEARCDICEWENNMTSLVVAADLLADEQDNVQQHHQPDNNLIQNNSFSTCNVASNHQQNRPASANFQQHSIVASESAMLADRIVNQEECGRKRVHEEIIAQTNTEAEFCQLLNEFSFSNCKVCCLNRINNGNRCREKLQHNNFLVAAKQKSDLIVQAIIGKRQKEGISRVNIEKYLVCMKSGCYVPQKLCNRTMLDSKGNFCGFNPSVHKCQHEMTLLNVVHLIMLIDKELLDQNEVAMIKDASYLMRTVTNFGSFKKTIRLVKLFYDMVKT